MLPIFAVTGPPGAGKSTALLALQRAYPEVARFGVRDYALAMAKEGHPFGLQLRTALEQGILFTDDEVRQEFAHFLSELTPGTEAVIVEGYPRARSQCRDLLEVIHDAGHRLVSFIALDIPDAVALQRVARRRLCKRCGLPAADAALSCSDCGGLTVPRLDDQPEVLARRLAEYRSFTGAVQKYFETKGLFHVIDGQDELHRVGATLTGMVLAHLPRKSADSNAS